MFSCQLSELFLSSSLSLCSFMCRCFPRFGLSFTESVCIAVQLFTLSFLLSLTPSLSRPFAFPRSVFYLSNHLLGFFFGCLPNIQLAYIHTYQAFIHFTFRSRKFVDVLICVRESQFDFLAMYGFEFGCVCVCVNISAAGALVCVPTFACMSVSERENEHVQISR